MSLLTTLAKGIIGGYVTGGAAGAGIGAAGAVLGSGSEENIARALSKQAGCTIPQASASQARALMAKGVNPCTGQNYDTGGMPAGYPTIPVSVLQTPVPGGSGAGMVGAGSSVVGGGGALEYTKTGLVRSVIVAGRRISRRSAAQFIRKHGFEVAASAFGLTMAALAKIILDESQRPRRRKGLTYKQISQAKNTIARARSMTKHLGLSSTRRSASRRTSSRASASCR